MLSRKGRSETQGWLRRNADLLIGATVWSVIMSAALAINLRLDQHYVVDLALAEARMEGKALTLISPSLAARQGHAFGRSGNGIRGHVTSLDPVSPRNRPDDWERNALKRLAATGAVETSEVRNINGRSYLSLMRSLVVEQNCLECHAGQGYSVGHIRGAFSVNVPMAPIWDSHRQQVRIDLAGYGVGWLIGLGALTLRTRVLQRRAQERHENEAIFRDLFENAPVAYHELDREGIILRVNRAECALLGYEAGEMLWRPAWEFVAEEDREASREAIRRKLSGQQPLEPPQRHYVRRDGGELLLETHDSLVRNATGEISGIRTALLNIGERKRAEDALSKSEDELRRMNEELERRVEERTSELGDARRVALSMMQDANLQRVKAEEVLKKLAESTSSLVMLWQAVENSPTVVVITDTEGKIQYVNPKFVEVTGYSAEEAVGNNPRILKSGEHTPEFYQHLWTTIKAGKTWRGELYNRKKNGEFYWEAASISPVRAADGEIRQFLAIKEDVTGIMRTAEALMRARDAADAANQAKSDFLASMSHEIRTPLNAILGYSQLLLRDEALGAGPRESLLVINRSGEHLLAVINDILEVSKIEAGRVGLEPAEFDLHAMLDDLAAMFRLPTVEKGIGLEVTKTKDLPRYVIADEGKTRQVLINLLGNAVKFTKQGQVRVSAAVSQAESGQSWLAVEVEDTGSGIAPEEMGKLFQYFEQTRSGREAQSGTGLGLVISRDYARRMGGDISVGSEQGKGSVFRFEIPIALAAAKPDGKLPAARRVMGLARGQAPPRVLVVDDQDSNRGWLCALLGSVGFEVREAGNGREALDIWQAWRPELILMDMRMPLMDGYEATRRIRSTPGGDSTVIIALTASALDERTPAMMNAGVDDLVCKPCKEGRLFERISTHLDVEYRYEESEGFAETQYDKPVFPTAVSLSGLPAELLAGMRQAILGCDMDGLIQILPQVAELDPSAAVSLQKLAAMYDYDALARIVSESQ